MDVLTTATRAAVDTSGFLNTTIEVPIGVLLLLFLLIVLPTGDIISLAREGIEHAKQHGLQTSRDDEPEQRRKQT